MQLAACCRSARCSPPVAGNDEAEDAPAARRRTSTSTPVPEPTATANARAALHRRRGRATAPAHGGHAGRNADPHLRQRPRGPDPGRPRRRPRQRTGRLAGSGADSRHAAPGGRCADRRARGPIRWPCSSSCAPPTISATSIVFIRAMTDGLPMARMAYEIVATLAPVSRLHAHRHARILGLLPRPYRYSNRHRLPWPDDLESWPDRRVAGQSARRDDEYAPASALRGVLLSSMAAAWLLAVDTFSGQYGHAYARAWARPARMRCSAEAGPASACRTTYRGSPPSWWKWGSNSRWNAASRCTSISSRRRCDRWGYRPDLVRVRPRTVAMSMIVTVIAEVRHRV